MVDESTDVSHHGLMVLYLKFLMNGMFVVVFWRIIEVHEATALALFAIIKLAYEQDMIPKRLLLSFASDGATVMTGVDNGVAVLLRDRFMVFMVLCHCIAHRHALPLAAAMGHGSSGQIDP